MIRIEKQDDSPERQTTVPIEDIVVLDHQQITITHGAMAALLDNNAAVVTCDKRHLPVGLMLPLFDIVQDIVLVIFVYFVMSNISSNVFFLSKSQQLNGGDRSALKCQISLLMSSF